MQRKRIFFAGVVLCLVAAGWGYYQYQKPRVGAADLPPAFRMTAEELYNAYSTNEAAASKTYDTKIIEVTGLVTAVQTTSRTTNLLIGGTEGGGVNCSLQNSHKTNAVQGAQITLKGRCAGFLMDVSLVDAVQVNK